MTKGELTARRKTTECGRHALLTKSGGWQKAATREQGVRSHDQEARYLELWKRSYEEAELHVEFAQVCKEYQRADAAHIATLKMALGTFAGKAGVLKADPVAKKQKTEPRKALGGCGWGGSEVTPRSCL
jgi:hypothetical protein